MNEIIVFVVVSSRFRQRPQKRNLKNQLTEGRLTKEIDREDPESQTTMMDGV